MFLFLLLRVVSSYVISQAIYKNPKILSFCPTIHPNLRLASYEVASEINHIQFSQTNPSGIICNKNTPEYGKTEIYLSNFNTDITLSNSIMNLPNTLYNVLLHEILHGLGLKHSKEKGMMNYSITVDEQGPIEDHHKLWLSSDDLEGIKSLINNKK